LRSYDGIFDFPASVDESQLAKFIGIKKEGLVKMLNELKALGFINYTFQKEKPQIYFAKNRVKTNELFINQKNILKRKEAYKTRLSAMISFCKNESKCRSEIINFYFDGPPILPCGICDNCLRNKDITISTDEFNSISSAIKKITQTNAVTANGLFQQLPLFKEKKIREVLRFLQEENLLIINEEGLVRSK